MLFLRKAIHAMDVRALNYPATVNNRRMGGNWRKLAIRRGKRKPKPPQFVMGLSAVADITTIGLLSQFPTLSRDAELLEDNQETWRRSFTNFTEQIRRGDFTGSANHFTCIGYIGTNFVRKYGGVLYLLAFCAPRCCFSGLCRLFEQPG